MKQLPKPMSGAPVAYFPFRFTVSGEVSNAPECRTLLVQTPQGAGDEPTPAGIRRVADVLNRAHSPSTPVRSGALLAFALIEEAQRLIIEAYVAQFPSALSEALVYAGDQLVAPTLKTFVRLYPPPSVLTGKLGPAAYLRNATAGLPHRCLAAREMALLKLATENPAVADMVWLFDDVALRRDAPYEAAEAGIEAYFENHPPVAGLGMSLFAALRAPMRACPNSLEGQLEYIRVKWASVLPGEFLRQLTFAGDLIREETRFRGLGPGPAPVLRFDLAQGRDAHYPEPAQFSEDRDWMANVVLMAKNAHVWLHQLSKTYRRSMIRLDQIPDEELDRLARWGFTGLWLIGLWERSPASESIKRMMGNPEAAASAYSLYDYVVAGDLGGEAALRDLAYRAGQRGIRLASDMVPNHVGVYSRWVVEHPDWFIQTKQPPFPAYRFTGANLSSDPRIEIRIEDGYWNRGDAAVVFQRVDTWTGEVRYIYHGNDGTSMPWNDTAQLDFVRADVREAVIQTILHVARQFPIIRFDAAMTLAKRHYQRLWFPQPGDAGAIPSRAEHGMTRPQFDQVFPNEFWREVVDRVTAEAPDTLLLAEAFWLMEGYFVRTLGMHRVYNSAFMNMLKLEDNANYRLTVKNVLEFSPAVLQRFVSFMNNPDELTAVEQFGKDDKYYGVAVMLVTMPGLPMFGHGQVEGFREKYGMEYRRAYWDEAVDDHMVYRHEREIFPLMRKRRLFSGADRFALYDFVVPEGWVDENVFAYSNTYGGERALVLYNNAYHTTRGNIHTSTAINVGDAEHKNLVRKSLAEALDLNARDDYYCIFRDHRTGLEYLRNAGVLAREGLHLELKAYQYYAFLDFREVADTDGLYARLDAALAGSGVISIEEARLEIVHAPVVEQFRAFLRPERLTSATPSPEWANDLKPCVDAVIQATGARIKTAPVVEQTHALIDRVSNCHRYRAQDDAPKAFQAYLDEALPGEPSMQDPMWRCTVTWALCSPLLKTLHAIRERHADGVPPEMLLQRIIAQALARQGVDEPRAELDAMLVSIMSHHAGLVSAPTKARRRMELRLLLEDPTAQRYLQFNRYQGVVWLNKEQATSAVRAIYVAQILQARFDVNVLSRYATNARNIERAVDAAGYRVEAIAEHIA